MPISFKEYKDNIQFKYQASIPDATMVLCIKKGDYKYRVKIAALYFYLLYRDTVYGSYQKKRKKISNDIQVHKVEYKEKTGSKNFHSAQCNDSLYHYAVASALDAMQDWQQSKGDMKSFFAYQYKDGKKHKVGFVHFIEKNIDGKSIVYISQAGVMNRREGIGTRLMQCVLAHYPAGTKFRILARVFNEEAKHVYGTKLKFDEIEPELIEKLGYNDNYCGYRHKSTEDEIKTIKAKFNTATPLKKSPRPMASA